VLRRCTPRNDRKAKRKKKMMKFNLQKSKIKSKSKSRSLPIVVFEPDSDSDFGTDYKKGYEKNFRCKICGNRPGIVLGKKKVVKKQL
jgi:hypothetical protein